MLKYILKKIGIAVLTIFVLITLTFFLVKLLPGDPFRNEKVPAAIQARQREYYGLDKPVFEQYLTYLNNLLHGDLGTSLKSLGRSVTDIIKEHFPVSAQLGLFSLIIHTIIGLFFGILCAQYRGRWPDYLLLLIAVIGVALPVMVIGPLLRYLLGVKLAVLPVAGWGSFKQLLLPSFVLGLSTVATYTRNMRASMLGIMSQDYIKTARAKGLSPSHVILKHELKNAIVPLMSSMGVSIATILSGTFVVEDLFLIPGLGRHFVNSITALDYPLVMGLTLFYGSFLVVMNLLVDILYGIVDPRIRVN